MQSKALFTTAASGSVEEFAQLLLVCTQGTNAGTQHSTTGLDEAGRTLFYTACMHGNVDVARFLVDRGLADVARSNQLGMTPVCAAACQGHLSAVQFLCEGLGADKVDVEAGDCYGARPAFVACMSGHEGVVRYLVEEQHVDLAFCTTDGQTCFFTACDQGHLRIARYLAGLLSQEDIAAVTNRGWTPLIAAACRGHGEIVNFLLEDEHARQDPDAVTHNGQTAFFGAACHGQDTVARRLAASSPGSIIRRDVDDQTPLYAAAHSTSLKSLSWCLQACFIVVAVDAYLELPVPAPACAPD